MCIRMLKKQCNLRVKDLLSNEEKSSMKNKALLKHSMFIRILLLQFVNTTETLTTK